MTIVPQNLRNAMYEDNAIINATHDRRTVDTQTYVHIIRCTKIKTKSQKHNGNYCVQ